MKTDVITDCIGFEWDTGNSDKNWKKHQVSPLECEQLFFNMPLLIYEDMKHSQTEQRIYALGRTNECRKLFVAFTVRNKKIRIISARNMSKKEREFYDQA